MNRSSPRVAIVWRGDREARRTATPQNNRFHRIFEELAAAGLAPEPAVFDEEFADEVLEQLLAVDAVLVWVNPLDDGKTRKVLDPLLLKVAEAGRFVSAHPDVILKMGVKEVLYETRHIGWGVDTHLYRTPAEFPGGILPEAAGQGAASAEKKPWQRRSRHLEGGARESTTERPDGSSGAGSEGGQCP